MDCANRSHRVFNNMAAQIKATAITRESFRPTRKSGDLFIGSSRCIYVRGLYHCLGAFGKGNFCRTRVADVDMNSGHIMFSRSWVRLEDIVSVAAALARRPRKLARGKWNAKGRTSVPTYLRLVVLTTFYAAALPQVRQIPASHSSSDAALIEGGQIFAARC